MKSRLPSILFLAAFLLTACQPKSSDKTTSQVQLASEPDSIVAQPLEASFMSDGQSFAYTFHYDGALMQIVDGQFDGAGVVGPSFSVSGGAQIVVQSETSAAVSALPAMAEKPQDVNGLTVYHSSELQGSCAVDTSVIPVSVEALVLTVKICDGQDSQAGQQAFYSLLEGLEVKAL